MAISRKLRFWFTAAAVVVLIGGWALFALLYYARRLSESDLLWVGTKSVGLQLIMYADEHGGQFPATLEDSGFASKLDGYAKAYLRHLRPEYSPPVTHGTNSVRMLTAQTRWETVTFYSDGDVVGAHR